MRKHLETEAQQSKVQVNIFLTSHSKRKTLKPIFIMNISMILGQDQDAKNILSVSKSTFNN
jgi:hypothetical protein